MNVAQKTFLEYQKLSRYDRQLVFRDMVIRIYRAIHNKKHTINAYREIQPESEYKSRLYPLDVHTIRDIKGWEMEVMRLMEANGILKGFKRRMHIVRGFVFKFEANYWSFQFSLTSERDFFMLHDLIFPEEKKEFMGENPRILLDFDDIASKLRIRDSDTVVQSVHGGLTPDKIMRKIFIDGMDEVHRRDFTSSEISPKTTMRAVLGKSEVYPYIFDIGKDYVRLKRSVDRDEIISLSKKH